MVFLYNCCVVEKFVRIECNGIKQYSLEQNRIEKIQASELDVKLEVEIVNVYCA